MVQESATATWDLRAIDSSPSTSTKIYILFLLAVCIFASVKLVRVWWTAPPFRLSKMRNSPAYLQRLETENSRFGRWIGFVFLWWGIFASVNLQDACNGLLSTEAKVINSLLIVYEIREFSTNLTAALLVVLFLYLIRWHLQNRIERLRHMPD
jgi:UDP-N-acetylmuramyl pentapeptide phosphotransferase/UDP-N-acetylglucosamine-1-phosphate transferase